MFVAIGSVKGPGVTSTAVALAARWPTAPGPVVVEADPAGGDLAFRFGHHRQPGLSALAADTRRGDHLPNLDAYGQRLRLGVDVVFGPADPEAEQTVRLLAATGLPVLRAAATIRRPVVVDVGRLGWQSPAWPLAAAADVLLLMCPAGLDGVDAAACRRDRILAITGMRAEVRLLLCGDSRLSGDEIAGVVGLPVAGWVPFDAAGAAVVSGRAMADRGWTRLPLLRAARALALTLTDSRHHRSDSPPSSTMAAVQPAGRVIGW